MKQSGIDTAAEIVDALRHTTMLADIDGGTLGRIAEVARRVSVDEGEVLYSVGDPARSAYVVEEGRLRFTLGGDGRPSASGAIIPAGDILGWAALLVDQPRRIATVVALEPCSLLEIPGKALLQILEKEPRAGYAVMQRLARMITQSFLEQSAILESAS